jgi:hypothetical protein
MVHPKFSTAGKPPRAEPKPKITKARKGDAATTRREAAVLFNKGLGHHMKKEAAAAKENYRQAADKGHLNAMYNLGYMYYEDKDYNNAKTWLQKAAYKGHVSAMNNLGCLYRDCEGRDNKAKRWLQKAADKGDAHAMFNLGCMFHAGQGGDRDDNKAKEWFQRAADKDHVKAMFNLGCMYRHGEDKSKAAEWLQKAADRGDSGAMVKLGCMYYQDKDYNKAKELYQAAADNGNDVGHFNLGVMLMYGLGGEKADSTQVMTCFQQAADGGDDGALVAMGFMHLKSYFAEGGVLEAEECFKKAAVADHDIAMWLLIDMYRGHQGRREEALELYRRVISTKVTERVEDYFKGEYVAEVNKIIADSRKWCEEQTEVVRGPQTNKRSAPEAPETEGQAEGQPSKKKASFGAILFDFLSPLFGVQN